MRRSVEIIGQPVVSITEGKEFGHVKELLINYANGSIAALVIDDGKWYLGAKVLPFEAIAGLGEYAVTINNSDDFRTVTDMPEFEKLFEAGIRVIGTKVLTKGGKIQGTVNEIIIDNTGKINLCEMEKVNGEVVNFPAKNVVTFGKEVVIIAVEGEVAAVIPEAKTAISNIELPVQPKMTMPPANVAMPAAVPIVENKEQNDDPVDQRKSLLGKKVARRIATDNGMLIVDRGSEITEEVLQKAKLAGKFDELLKAPLM